MAINLRERAPDDGVDARTQAQDIDAHAGGVGVGELGRADVAALAGAVEHLDAAVVAFERLGHEEGDGGWGFAQGGVDRRVGAGQQGVGGGGRRIVQQRGAGHDQDDRKQRRTPEASHCAPAAARSVSSLHCASVSRPRQSCQPWNSPGATAKGAPPAAIAAI